MFFVLFSAYGLLLNIRAPLLSIGSKMTMFLDKNNRRFNNMKTVFDFD